MQNHLNLLYREEEREMLPLCADQGIAVIPWSPLARGKLARPWTETPPTKRAETDQFGRTLYRGAEQSDRAIVGAVQRLAADRGVPMAQVAIAWLLARPGITAPIIGASRMQHLDDAVGALSLQLSADDIAALEAAYIPRAVSGF
jgi:aryl-alcohol dehydrogenase-like predicted oxidoreductase